MGWGKGRRAGGGRDKGVEGNDEVLHGGFGGWGGQAEEGGRTRGRTGRGMVVVVVVVGVQPGAGWPVFKTHSLSSPPTPRQDVEDREPFKSTKVGEQ